MQLQNKASVWTSEQMSDSKSSWKQNNRVALANWITHTIADKFSILPGSKLIYEDIDHFRMMLNQRSKSGLGR